MLPFINQKKSIPKGNSIEDWSKLHYQSSNKMIDALSVIAKTNEDFNRKTDKLLQIANSFSSMSNNILKFNQEMAKNTTDSHKYIKRIDKRISLFTNDKNNQKKQMENTQYQLSRFQSNGELKTLYNQGFFRKQTLGSNNQSKQNLTIKQKTDTSDFAIKSIDQTQSQVSDIKPIQNFLKNQIYGLKNQFQSLKSQISNLNKNGQIQSSITVDFPQLRKMFKDSEGKDIDMKKCKYQISCWIGELYRAITDFTYYKFVSKIFSEEETRLFYCQCVIINSLNFLNYVRKQNKSFWIKYRAHIMQFIKESQRKILKFLKTKYPRNKKTFKCIQMDNVVQKIYNSEDPRYDILKNTQIQFPAKEYQAKFQSATNLNSGGCLKMRSQIHYIKQMKLFFNFLIKQVQNTYKSFHQNIQKIFTGSDKSKQGNGKYLIGKKFKQNIPLFKQQELETLDFDCKSPQVLRIIIKWLEQIEQLMNKPQQTVMHKKAFKHIKLKNKDAVAVSEKTRKEIVHVLQKQVKDNIESVNQKNQILLNLIDNISQLVESKPDNIEFLKQEDVKTIKFSQLVAASLPFFATNKIQFIIKILRNFQKNYPSKLLQQIDLLTFSVFDLLRSRCKGSQSQIIEIYNRLNQSKYFKLIRVKNRLDTPLNDILINCKIVNSPLICQIQLSVANQNFDQKTLKNDHFNHFLYELQRSRFGPLCEACLIINDSDPRMQYAPELKKVKMFYKSLTQKQKQKINLVSQVKTCHKGHFLTLLDFSLPFICTLCSYFNQQYSSSFDSYECKQCNLRICPCCYLSKLDDETKAVIYFGNEKYSNFYKRKYFQLRSFRTNLKNIAFESIVKDILIKEKQKYCMLIRFSQGSTTKKGYKLLGNEILCPVFFYIKNEIIIQNTFQRYDLIVILKQSDFVVKPYKQLKKYKDIETSQTHLQKKLIQSKAIQLKKNLLSLPLNSQSILIFDYDQDQFQQQNIKEILYNNRIKQILNQCSISKNTTLDISSRQLSQLYVLNKQIQHLAHVLTVVADQNKITNISSLLKLPHIRKISMKNNLVSQISDVILPDQLIDLFMAYNKFQIFPQIKAKSITRISFKQNQMKDLKNLQKCQLYNLIDLGLAQNLIQQFPIMKLPSLQKLILKQNKLKSINNISLQQCLLHKLQILDLEDNNIQEIPKMQFENLDKLILKKNKIVSTIGLQQSKLPRLSCLQLSDNRISVFKSRRLQYLMHLDLSINEIRSIQFINNDIFPRIKQINVSKNKIQKLSYIEIQSLGVLNLSSNNIYSLSNDKQMQNSFLESSLPNLQSLYLFHKNKFYIQGLIAKQVKRKLKNLQNLY